MTMKAAGLASAMLILSAPLAVNATPIYTSFGSLPGANFGGTGIPNDSVAKTEVFVNGTDQITLALTAHARYSNTPVTDNNAGDYYAGAGQNCGVVTDPAGCPSANQGALWNFAYYISVSGPGADFDDYDFTLYYDFDPGVGTFIMNLGRIDINNAIIANTGNPFAPAATTLLQDSQNLLFGFLDVACCAPTLPGTVTPPVYPSFNPNALGEYFFFIGFQKKLIPAFAGVVGIDVNVVDASVVPVPAAVWLFGSAIGLLAWVKRKASA